VRTSRTKSCNDPAEVDENSHGAHVAGTVAAALNGFGIAGVAPNVTLVNLRAGQDSGFYFLQASVDALVYAGDHGIDVVNMSYFIDPWLYNCASNPADSTEAQLEQRTIIAATVRALDYAQAHRHADLGFRQRPHEPRQPDVGRHQPRLPAGSELRTAVNRPCPDPPLLDCSNVGRPPEFNALCVDAAGVVRLPPRQACADSKSASQRARSSSSSVRARR
jgi:hypothetical protein